MEEAMLEIWALMWG